MPEKTKRGWTAGEVAQRFFEGAKVPPLVDAEWAAGVGEDLVAAEKALAATEEKLDKIRSSGWCQSCEGTGKKGISDGRYFVEWEGCFACNGTGNQAQVLRAYLRSATSVREEHQAGRRDALEALRDLEKSVGDESPFWERARKVLREGRWVVPLEGK